MSDLPQLDHAVINVRYEMDAAQQAFSDLGFHLTDRGYHTLGSINHLMMFGTDYLELIGLPADGDREQPGRPDIANAPYGINGLVFKTDDVDKTFAHLQSVGLADAPPKSFSRPVELDGETVDASFRTVHVAGDAFPGGRVYFCQHLTPQYVWRPEWQDHANGVQAMPEFVVVATDLAEQTERFAALLQSNVDADGDTRRIAIDGSVITVLSPDAYAARYGEVASGMNGRSSIFGALVFRTSSLDAARTIAKKAQTSGAPVIDEPDRVAMRQPDFDCVMEFV